MRSVEEALAWLDRQASSGSTAWYNLCLSLAAQAFGLGYSGVGSYGRANPTTFWNNANVVQRHEGDTNPPAGALVFWQKPGRPGHIAVSAGDGMVYTNDFSGRGGVSVVPLKSITRQWGMQYMGWGAPAFPSGGSQVAEGFDASARNRPQDDAGSGLNSGSGGEWLARFLYAKGLRGNDLKTAWAIAMRESGGTPGIDNAGLNSNGSTDFGLFQINSVHANRIKEKFGWSMDDLRDPNKAFAVYWWMSNGGKKLGVWNIGSGAYDPANSGEHTRKYNEYRQQFQSVAQKAGLKTAGTTQVDRDARQGAAVRATNTGADGTKPDKLSESEAAKKYGYVLALFKSDKELWNLLQTAISKEWDAAEFQVRLEQTDWYRTHGESWRVLEAEMYSDPKSYAQKMLAEQARLAEYAGQVGAVLGPDELKQIAWRSLRYGWSESQVRAELAKHITEYNVGGYGGQAGDIEDSLTQLAFANGVTMDSDFYRKAVQSVVAGTRTQEEWEDYIRRQAASMYPVYANDILEGGMNVRDLAQNYVSRMSSILELDPNSIELTDPLLRSALSNLGEDGKPAAMGIWDFENKLRQDPRWMKTKNAKDKFDSTTTSILRQFGFMG